MNPAEVYRTALRLGVTLRAVEGNIDVDSPDDVDLEVLIAEITAVKQPLLRLLLIPEQLCRQLWAQTLEEVSTQWSVKTCLLTETQKDAWWLDEALDLELQQSVRAAILAGNPERTFEAVERWQEAWRKCLCGEKKFQESAPPAPPPSPAPPIGAQDGNVPKLTDISEPSGVESRSVEKCLRTLPASIEAHTTGADSTCAPSLFEGDLR